MSISLLDIWNFIINFNLLGLIPLAIILFFSFQLIDNEGFIYGSLVSVIVYLIVHGIFDLWLNWIELPVPQFYIDAVNATLIHNGYDILNE